MSKPVLLSGGNGKVQELAGMNDNDVLTWDAATSEWKSAAGGGGGSGTVTSVGLTGGTSGIVVGGTPSPITTSGTYNLDAPQRFAFDTVSPIAPTAAGQISWNATEGSLNTLMVGNNVDAVIGQQLYQRVVNNDTVPLTKGMVVYVDGSSGTRVTVQRATASADLTSATIIGVVAETIAVNATGFIITEGVLKVLNVLPATAFADGDVVYLSPTTPGALTATKPTAPQHLVMVGYCVKASNGSAGVLLVKTQNGYELGELHDVYINSPTSGQILIYDATTGQTRWENASLGGSNGVAVTQGAGSLSVGLNSASSPTLTGLTLSGLSNGLVRVATGVLAGGATVTGSDFSSQLPNTVFAAPDVTSGNPTFRPLIANDIPSLSAIYLPISGGTLTGKLITPASTTVTAGFNLPTGTAPTSPVSGDMWTTTANLFVRINTTTYTLGLLNNAQTWTASNTFSNSVNSFGTSTIGGTTGLATGATASGSTKTVNIGTSGVSGSTTVITIGATAGTSTTTINGTLAAETAAVDTSTTQVATTAYVVGQGYLKSATAASTYAPIASPTFTGTVTIPSGASISGYATTASLASYAPIASPTFTGIPLSTTAAVNTDTTQIATTAYVIGQASSSTPFMNGSASIGASLKYARADHVHPTDTSRAPLDSPSFIGTVAIPALTLTSALGPTYGGTGTGIYTTGDLLYASATNTLSRRAAGTTGQVLTMAGGVPTWAPASGGGVTSITGTSDQVIASASTGAITLSLPQSINTSSSPSFATLIATTSVVTDVLKNRTGSSIYIGDGTSSDPVIMEAGYRLGYGRSIVIRGGVPTGAALPGGDATFKGGDALSGGTGNGGNTFITGGSKNSGTGLDGIVYIGLSGTDSVVIGASGITTTINGTLSLLNKLAVSNLAAGTNGYVLKTVAGVTAWAAASSGTVTSVTLDAGSTGLTISAGFSQTITTSGTFTLGGTLGAGYGGTGVSTTAESYVFAGPASGSGTPSFRQLAAADITGISGTYAPLASPTFTGTVTIPAGASIAGYLTTATAASTYAPLASPTFTGTVTLPLSTAGYVKTTSGGVISSSASVPTSDLSGSIALGSQVSGQLPLANGGTNANLTAINGGAVYSNGSALAVTAAGTSGQFLKSSGAGAPAFASVTASDVSSIPYDLPAEVPGTPAVSTKVVNFKAVRAFTLASSGHQGGCAVTNPTGSAVSFTVKKNGSSSGVGGTITFNTDGTFSSSITQTSFIAGDLLTVETPSAVNGMDTPYFTLAMTLA